MTPEERKAPENGIWLCQTHAKAIDSDDPAFSEEVLHGWKRSHAQAMWRSVVEETPFGPSEVPTTSEIGEALRRAAVIDLDVFRRAGRWPQTDVSLMVKVESQPDPVLTNALALALGSSDDLVIVAPPGTGKTSALFQLAAGAVLSKSAVPLIISLPDWSTTSRTLIEEILRRPAFAKLNEAGLRAVAEQPGVVFMFDSWNELGSTARSRARFEIQTLRAELPAATFVITTRPDASEAPFQGQQLTVLELTEQQQMSIASQLGGNQATRRLDEAWRTSGVHELVSTPLYLTTLLSLPSDQPLPRTKGEILRRFVQAHEQQPQHQEPLNAVLYDLQAAFLADLAIATTQSASTSITENDARRSVFRTGERLVRDGQLTTQPQPRDVLETLVRHHLLVRTDNASYRFQHQQFQEWYAAGEIETAILVSVGNKNALDHLKHSFLNHLSWEEAILFAVERTASGDDAQKIACGVAIIAAFDVDPDLAAEMIFRSTEKVWAVVSQEIQSRVRRWHRPGTCDRAVRFMIASGRAEFRDLVWPLITDANNQKSLPALRSARRFRTSILGPDAANDVLALPLAVRKPLASELVYRSGVDGLDLAADVAKRDSSARVKAAVVSGLTFRRADRHVVEVISTADDTELELICREAHLDDVEDATLQTRIAAVRARHAAINTSHDRLRNIVYARKGTDHAAELTEIIATITLGESQDPAVSLIYEAGRRYGRITGEALLRRLKSGRELFHGADDILAASGLIVEDESLLELALSTEDRRDGRAAAAASVLGPLSVGMLIDAELTALSDIQKSGAFNKHLSDQYNGLRDRINKTPGSSLVAAVRARAANASPDAIQSMASLLTRPKEEGDRARPLPAETHPLIADMARDWAGRLIAGGPITTRAQLSAIADLIAHVPAAGLIETLRQLIDEELSRYRQLHSQAGATHWRGPDADEARMSYLNRYQYAATAISAPEIIDLMVQYLTDEHFGDTAALVIKMRWILANEPPAGLFGDRVDFSRVENVRAARALKAETSREAEALFAVIEPLIEDGSTEQQRRHAVKLAVHAVRLPHGSRPEVVRKLLGTAPPALRAAMAQNLVLAGDTIPLEVVRTALNDHFQEARKSPWTMDDRWHFKAWLLLLPFTDHPEAMADIVSTLPASHRDPYFLEEMVRATKYSTTVKVEDALLQLGRDDARFYRNAAWREAVRSRGTLTSAQTYVDLVIKNKIDDRDGQTAANLAELLKAHPSLRDRVVGMLGEAELPVVQTLANAIAECEDPAALLVLVKLEIRLGVSVISWRAIEGAVTRQVPSDEWNGAYEVLPVGAADLRQKLLALTTDGGAQDAAARALREIDRIRDENGAVEDEPRHPDLASGRPWPILSPDPNGDNSI